jgi:outer membrane protein OmpA-like peptidoglycan-associated protein
MKSIVCTLLVAIFFLFTPTLYSQIDILGKVKEKAEEKANEEIDEELDEVFDGTADPDDKTDQEEGNNEEEKEKQSDPDDGESDAGGSENSKEEENNSQATPVIKAYANYDFVAGEKILFEDNFQNDMDGEFPAHWDLISGQAIVNKQAGKTVFMITDGNYVRVKPLVKTNSYLGDEYTIEFDYFPPKDAFPIRIGFTTTDDNDQVGELVFHDYKCAYYGGQKSLSGEYPEELQSGPFENKWHHVAIAVKNKQMKVYIDQFRVLVVPNTNIAPAALQFMSNGDLELPVIFTNVKIAEGGKMNMLDHIMTDGKIITHGILFDVNQSVIKPESMGVINQIYQVMAENPDLKFSVNGHTDSDGSEEANLKLSQARAEAVMAQLISMGIDAGRLSSKGMGESAPIDTNETPEGKANNRRVEFVKM